MSGWLTPQNGTIQPFLAAFPIWTVGISYNIAFRSPYAQSVNHRNPQKSAIGTACALLLMRDCINRCLAVLIWQVLPSLGVFLTVDPNQAAWPQG